MKQLRMICLVAVLIAAATNICAAEWAQPVPPATTPSNGQNYYLYNPAVALFLDMWNADAVYRHRQL